MESWGMPLQTPSDKAEKWTGRETPDLPPIITVMNSHRSLAGWHQSRLPFWSEHRRSTSHVFGRGPRRPWQQSDSVLRPDDEEGFHNLSQGWARPLIYNQFMRICGKVEPSDFERRVSQCWFNADEMVTSKFYCVVRPYTAELFP